MWKNTFDPNVHCRAFTQNPLINPATKRGIERNGGVYQWLEKRCGRLMVPTETVVSRTQIPSSLGGSLRRMVKNTRKTPLGKFLDMIIDNPEYKDLLCKAYQKAQRQAKEAVLPKIIFSFGGRKIMFSATGPLSSKLNVLCTKPPPRLRPDSESPPPPLEGDNFCRTAAMKRLPQRQEFDPQEHQIRAQMFMRQNDRVLLYVGLGGGKTCSAAMIMMDYMKRNPKENLVYFISPGGLKRNFTEEFCTFCPEDRRLVLGDDSLVSRIRLFSLDDSTLKRKLPDKFENCLVVVDEAHRLIDAPDLRRSPDTDDHLSLKNLEILYGLLTEHQRNNRVKLVLMSGTPFPDTLEQHYNCLRLLKPVDMNLPFESFKSLFQVDENSDKAYNPSNPVIDELYRNCISFYATNVSDVPSVTYRMEQVQIEEGQGIGQKIVSAMQREATIRTTSLEKLVEQYQRNRNMTYVQARKQAAMDKYRAFTSDSSRRKSNFIYQVEGGVTDDESLFSLYTSDQILQMSPKLDLLVKNIQDERKCPGKQLVYCPFKEKSGVNLIGRVLSSRGVSCLVYSGDVSAPVRSKYLQTFNDPKNDQGQVVKVMLITDAAAEGISLSTVRGVHLFNESIYASHMNQVVGRAVRYRSHVRLPVEDRNVVVYRYRLSVLTIMEEEPMSPDEWCYQKGLQRIKKLTKLEELIRTRWSV